MGESRPKKTTDCAVRIASSYQVPSRSLSPRANNNPSDLFFFPSSSSAGGVSRGPRWQKRLRWRYDPGAGLLVRVQACFCNGPRKKRCRAAFSQEEERRGEKKAPRRLVGATPRGTLAE